MSESQFEQKKRSFSLGISDFKLFRENNSVYVDKTGYFLKLAEDPNYTCSFLSRPRRFGKSLMISTLEVMFKGQMELFRGLAAEEWVAKQALHPSPVLRFTMPQRNFNTPDEFLDSLCYRIRSNAEDVGIELPAVSLSVEDMLTELLRRLYKKFGPVVVLIDEYDRPILNNLSNPEKAESMRLALREFYTVLKDSGQYLRFLMLTGISKFSKMSIFSGINNLQDISMMPEFGAIVGFTQQELESNYGPWLDDLAADQNVSRADIIQRMKDCYDGFCFDGQTRVYNPWSVLNCLKHKDFKTYWYSSSTSSAVVQFIKRFGMEKPDVYENIVVDSDFVGSREIEHAKPDSFLYQSGYLTIKGIKKLYVGAELTLGIPNQEVRIALARTWLDDIYCLENYLTVSSELMDALRVGDLDKVFEIYNKAIKSVPYDTINKANPNEAFFQGVFIALLWSVSMTLGEVHSGGGRSDIVVSLQGRKEHEKAHIYVFELKLAENESNLKNKLDQAMAQIHNNRYAESYCKPEYKVTAVGVAIDREHKQATYLASIIQE